MPRLFINIHALRHNLAVMNELCRRAGTEIMFVFKEAPLHHELTAEIMKGSPVHRLGLVAWPNNCLPSMAGVEIHHVYAPSPLLSQKTAECSCVYINSFFSMHTLARGAIRKPQIRLSLEVGDGRDGAMPEELPALCEEAVRLDFSLRGLSVNFACLSNEAPAPKQLQAAVHALRDIREYCLPEADISAGGTDMLELAETFSLPAEIRELRCGTGVMLGVYPLSGLPVPGARQDTFHLDAQILECRTKKGRRTALVDIGTFHTAPECLLPPLPGIMFLGSSSGYTSFDVTECPETLQEGMTLTFRLDYHALSRALFSPALPAVLENK